MVLHGAKDQAPGPPSASTNDVVTFMQSLISHCRACSSEIDRPMARPQDLPIPTTRADLPALRKPSEGSR